MLLKYDEEFYQNLFHLIENKNHNYIYIQKSFFQRGISKTSSMMSCLLEKSLECVLSYATTDIISRRLHFCPREANNYFYLKW